MSDQSLCATISPPGTSRPWIRTTPTLAPAAPCFFPISRSVAHTSELQSHRSLHSLPARRSSDVGSISLRDYFTPWDQQTLDQNDSDFGSGGALLLPDQ